MKLADIQSPFLIFGGAALTLVLLLFPVAAASYPALVDFPVHLARHYIGESIHGSPDLQRYYSYEWRPVANMAGDVMYILLRTFFSPLDSERLIIAIIIGAWTVAPFLLNRAIWGEWSIAPCLSGLVVFNNSFRGGLENFLLASALSVFVFALWIHWRGQMTAWRVGLFAILACLIYFGHFLAWTVLLLLIGPYELQKASKAPEDLSQRVRQLVVAAVPFIPGVILFLTVSLTSRTSGEFATVYGGLESRVYAVLSLVLMYHPIPDLLALGTLIGVLAWRSFTSKGERVHPSVVFVLITLVLACLIAPAVLQDIRGVHVRLPAILMTIFIASINWRTVSYHQWRLIGAAFVLVLLLRSAFVTSYWLQHETEVSELRKGFEKLDRGAAVLSAVNRQADTGEFHWFSLAYAVMDRQIFTSSLYPSVHMLSVRPEYLRLTQLVADPVELSRLPVPTPALENKQKRDGYWRTWWQDYTHLLVLSRVPIEPQFKDHIELVSAGSFFRLYKIKPSLN